MIYAAVWYLDRWTKHPAGGGVVSGMVKADSDMMPAALVYGLATAGIPAIHIAALPYSKLVHYSYDLGDYVRRTEVMPWRSGARRLATKRGMLRIGAKIGSRFIPGVGWVLLAYDVYSAANYLHEEGYF